MNLNIKINGKEIIACTGQTILKAALENGIEIPSLCHDERVKEYGACGICVVESENNPRLLRACATKLSEGMSILTDTPKVLEARSFALELLLSDHQGDCRPPCMLKCPGQTDCQGYVGLIANGKLKEASVLIKDVIPLPASIGRICPHPCEDACRRELVEEPISIAALKSVAGDFDLANGTAYIPPIAHETGKTVAVIGGGPGGLSAAYQLRRLGHEVTVFDAMPKMGGMLRYGIPEYRLPKALLDQEIDLFPAMGITLINDIRIGKDKTLDELREAYDAVIVAIGAWQSTGISCPGDDLSGVVGGIDFLRSLTLNDEARLLASGKKVAVVGGGNTAMDACRTAKRLGASEVYIIYRRTRAEMPAEEIEIKEAEEEGIIFKYLTNPLEIIGNDSGSVKSVRLQLMELGEPDQSGRRSPAPIEGACEELSVDTVIMAIGQGNDNAGFEALELSRWKTIIADEKTFKTNLDNVFALGDATNNGASIAIEAIGEAKRASVAINEYLINGTLPEMADPIYVTDEKTRADFAEQPKIAREQMEHVSPEVRIKDFKVITDGLSLAQAKKEASRCLECGCADIYECRLLAYANRYGVNQTKYSGQKNNLPLDDSNEYFVRNMNKCILCGLCVRVCDEAIGRTALGFVGRGFSTSLDQTETDCISCGQCVLLCPTGAITERLLIDKAVPLAEKNTLSTCAFCSVGCQVNLTSAAGMVLRSLPQTNVNKKGDLEGRYPFNAPGNALYNAMLCKRGRFEIPKLQKEERILSPLIRRDGELVPCTYEEAYAEIAEKVMSIRSVKENNIGVSVSDRRTNEEIFVIKEFALGLGAKAFSHHAKKSGLVDILGRDASTCTFEDLNDTDVILMVCPDIMETHPIAGLKVKKAVENGAKLILISNEKSQSDEWASVKTETHEDILDALEIYENAGKAIIIFDQNAVSEEDADDFAQFAVNAGFAKPGAEVPIAGSGIIQLKKNNNSQGLANLGIGVKENKNIQNFRGLFIFGEDVKNLDREKLDFLVVHETSLTETAKKADVVLPACGYFETGGTYLNTVGELKTVRAAVTSPVKGNRQTVYELAEALGFSLTHRSDEEIRFAFLAEM
ncbi:MAG: FAD-dependent oxidoreductase [Lachnospiraceae bacterium]|nr:FAD-dependent oxidoreductase [Lachnospiraceae bacterium]